MLSGADFLRELDDISDDEVEIDEPAADPNAGEPRAWSDVENFLEEEEKQRALAATEKKEEEATGSASGSAANGKETENGDDTIDLLKIIPPSTFQQIRLTYGGDLNELSLGSEHFNAVKYLATYHSRTPYDNLRSTGPDALQGVLKTKEGDIINLVNSNFELFVRCKDTIDEFHSALVSRDADQTSGGAAALDGVVALDGLYEKVNAEIARVYGTLLRQKVEADQIRGLLLVIDRSKFIFKMPALLKLAIQREDDEKVIQINEKVHETLTNTQNVLFQRVLSECEALVEGYRQQLFRVLENPTNRISDVERVISVLGQLGMVGSSSVELSSRLSNVAPPDPREMLKLRRLETETDPVRYYLKFHVARIKADIIEKNQAYHRKKEQRRNEMAAYYGGERSGSSGSTRSNNRISKAEYIKSIGDLVTQQMPQIYNVVEMFSSVDEDEEDEDDDENESEESANSIGDEGAKSMDDDKGHKKGRNKVYKKIKGNKVMRIMNRLGATQSIVMDSQMTTQKKKEIRVLTDDGTWATMTVRRAQPAKVLFQQMLKYTRENGFPRAKEEDYSLSVVLKKKGKDVIKELSPYDRPYHLHKKFGKEGTTGYFFFKRKTKIKLLGKSTLIATTTAAAKAAAAAPAMSKDGPKLSVADAAAAAAVAMAVDSKRSANSVFLSMKEAQNDLSEVTTLLADQALSVFREAFEEDNVGDYEEDFGYDDASAYSDADDYDKTFSEESFIENNEELQRCVRTVKDILNEVFRLGFPEKIISPIAACYEEMEKEFVNIICTEARQITVVLHNLETWEKATDGPYTTVPKYFSKLIKSLLKILDDVLSSKDPLRQEISPLFLSTIDIYTDTLHHLAFVYDDYTQDNVLETSQAIGAATSELGSSNMQQAAGAGAVETGSGNGSPPENERLLRILANCVHCRTIVFPGILEYLGYTPADPAYKNICGLVSDLETMVCQKYMSYYSVEFSGIVAAAITGQKINWSKASEVAQVPAFALNFLLELSRVHAEIHEVAPQFARRVLQGVLAQFIRTVRAEVVRLPALGYNGAVQIYTALRFAKNVLKPYATKSSEEAYKTCLGSIEEMVTINRDEKKTLDFDNFDESDKVNEIVDSELARTQLLFACFDSK